MRTTSFVTAAATLVLTGTTVLAQNVSYDFDKSTDFSKFKTYALVRGTVLADEINHNRIVSALNAQLEAKGLAPAGTPATADLLVAYHATFDRDLEISGFGTGFGPYRFGSRSGVARTEKILTGTLAVDIVDSRTNAIVWRGTASNEIDAKADPKKRERNISRAAERLFKNYPPVK